jgi:DNA-binding winged helix-turn-helix (wHTH) protein/Tol biopolymer transport system component
MGWKHLAIYRITSLQSGAKLPRVAREKAAMGMSAQSESHIRFKEYDLDLRTRELRTNGHKLILQEQPFQILSALLERPGDLVNREELRKRLWSDDTFVDFDRGLNKAVNRLREVLDDSADQPRFIETLPRQGYRFIAPVERNGAQSADASESLAGKQVFPLSWRVVAGTLAALVAVAVLWWIQRHPPSMSGLPELKQRQLTANPTDNPVMSGAISPDGRYLAYADLKGIHIKLIETGETADVPQPEEVKGARVDWAIVPTWVHDGTRFIANANTAGRGTSIWIVSVVGGAPRKLRDNSEAESVSRDGSRVAFATNWGRFGYRELWVMRADGEGAYKLYDVDESSFFLGAEWSPDGQRLAYLIAHEGRDRGQMAIESRDLVGGAEVTALPDAITLEDWSWLPDGRIVWSLDEPGPAALSCNLWAMLIDAGSGKPAEKPNRLTNWAGFCMANPSPSADSKRLVFRRWLWQANIFVADLDHTGTRLTSLRKLTTNEGRNFPAGWTRDSDAVVFESYRDGQWQILKQSLGRETTEPLVTVTVNLLNPQVRVSADGAWILYPAGYSSTGGSSAPYQLMRIPINGGSAEQVLTASFYDSAHSRIAPGCAQAPASLCAIAERSADGKQITFTAFDPLRGRGREIAHIDIEPTGRDYVWDLSPDGTRIAFLQLFGAQNGPSAGGKIRVIPLDGQAPREIVVKGWNSLQSVDWAADGKALFVSGATPQGSALLRVDMQGNAKVLWERKGSIEPWFARAPWAVPSPDGRHLAIYDWQLSSNMWMVENF